MIREDTRGRLGWWVLRLEIGLMGVASRSATLLCWVPFPISRSQALHNISRSESLYERYHTHLEPYSHTDPGALYER